MYLKVTRKHTNLAKVRNAVNRRITLNIPTTADYRRKVIEAASAPLTGPIGDVKVQRERAEREAASTIDKRVRERLPRFDDIL